MGNKKWSGHCRVVVQRDFIEPMDWATDEQLRIMQAELKEELDRLMRFQDSLEMVRERIGLKQLELEMKLRGIA